MRRKLILVWMFAISPMAILAIMLNSDIVLFSVVYAVTGCVSFLGGFFSFKLLDRALPTEGGGWRAIPLLLYAMYVFVYTLGLLCVIVIISEFFVPSADSGVQVEVSRSTFLFFAILILGGALLHEILKADKVDTGE